MGAGAKQTWNALLLHFQAGGAGKLTPRWQAAAPPPIDAVGFTAFKKHALRWFPLVGRPRTVPAVPAHLFLAHKSWPLAAWRERYLDHTGWSARLSSPCSETSRPRARPSPASGTRVKSAAPVVRGGLRSYKIHLGSGNILMEPNDQYLCIVPKQTVTGSGRVFLPFEGDGTLAVILSKAFLLADDAKITDPTITSQLRRG